MKRRLGKEVPVIQPPPSQQPSHVLNKQSPAVHPPQPPPPRRVQPWPAPGPRPATCTSSSRSRRRPRRRRTRCTGSRSRAAPSAPTSGTSPPPEVRRCRVLCTVSVHLRRGRPTSFACPLCCNARGGCHAPPPPPNSGIAPPADDNAIVQWRKFEENLVILHWRHRVVGRRWIVLMP